MSNEGERERVAILGAYFRARGWRDPSGQVIDLARAAPTSAGATSRLLQADFLTANRLTRDTAGPHIFEVLQSRSRPRRRPEPEVVAVVFVDLARSTDRVARGGDELWRSVIEDFYERSRTTTSEARGRIIKTTGDGFLATIPSATAALNASEGFIRNARDLGLEARVAIHLTEVTPVGDDDIGGIGVNLAARLLSYAPDGLVLVSSTVVEAAAGSRRQFRQLGIKRLKGIPHPQALWLYEGRSRRD